MYEICPTCGGRGDVKVGDTRQSCPQCNGTGIIENAANNQATGMTPGAPLATSNRTAWPMFLLGLLAALALVSILVLVWLVTLFAHGTPININNQNSNGNTHITVNGASPTPPGAFQLTQTATTPTPIGTLTQAAGNPTPSAGNPTPSATPARPTPTRASTHTPTATPIPAPVLFVAPQSIHLTVCVAGSSTFVTGNHGGGALHWAAKASNALYQVAPAQGSLGAGQTQTVQVTDITLNGSIAISSNGGAATVYITCG